MSDPDSRRTAPDLDPATISASVPSSLLTSTPRSAPASGDALLDVRSVTGDDDVDRLRRRTAA